MGDDKNVNCKIFSHWWIYTLFESEYVILKIHACIVSSLSFKNDKVMTLNVCSYVY